ncbi:MAG: cell wall-active antibiotics response protein [Oscillospiraceae bacterium]|nr:cell wall-active antibiotics response protein [Oscillospiraceae bacterium]
MDKNTRKAISKVAWGLFWLLLAGLIVANTFGGFVDLTAWSIIIGAIALVILFHCFATLSFGSLPVPLAALYYIFQDPLGLPFIAFWPLALVTVLLTIGLHILLPKQFNFRKYIHINTGVGTRTRRGNKTKYDKYGNRIDRDDYADVVIDGNDNNANDYGVNGKTKINEGDDPNNPYISVSFGAASRYLHAESLETAEFVCSFGSLEVYFDNVTLSPNGAEVDVSCSFGSIEIFVPPHWRVIDDVNSSLANAEISRKLQNNDADAPTLKITGSVSLGNVEVSRIKGYV